MLIFVSFYRVEPVWRLVASGNHSSRVEPDKPEQACRFIPSIFKCSKFPYCINVWNEIQGVFWNVHLSLGMWVVETLRFYPNTLLHSFLSVIFTWMSVAYWGGWFGVFKPPQNSEGPPKSCQTHPDCENC